MEECKGKNRGTLPHFGGCRGGNTPPDWGKENELYRAFLARKQRGIQLTPKQTRALRALLTCPTQAAAAQAAGVGLSTLKRYLADDEFQREYQKAVSGLIAEAAQSGRLGMVSAMGTLRSIADDKNVSAQNRIMACRSLLEFSLKLDERENVLRRLDELEAQIGGGEHG